MLKARFRSIFLAIRTSFIISLVCIGFSCSVPRIRLPASKNYETNYNPVRIKALKQAADNGVLFIVNDHVFRDVEKEEIDNKCRHQSDPEWSEQLFSYLEVMSQHPSFYKKIHVIELRKGDVAKIDLQKDLDNLTYLTITYAKTSSATKVTAVTKLPCEANSTDYKNRELTTVRLVWPHASLIPNVLANLPERPNVERFNFDRQFLGFLAERNTILKFSQELGFEKTPDGRFALIEVLSKIGQDLSKPDQSTGNINYWLYEISRKSTQASSVQMFGLIKDIELGHGVKVETEGEFARKILGHQDPTYIFMSYKIESGNYFNSSLNDLDTCLGELTDVMSGSFNSRKPASEERNSFLRPGFSCRPKAE